MRNRCQAFAWKRIATSFAPPNSRELEFTPEHRSTGVSGTIAPKIDAGGTLKDNSSKTTEVTTSTEPTPAFELRENVISRHRKEVQATRRMMYDAVNSKCPLQARTAKLIAETMQLLHKMERVAWGLNGTAPEDLLVIIDRV